MHMKRKLLFLAVIAVVTAAWPWCQTGHATTVNLYVDSAPNRYGSPNWSSWWDATKSDVVASNFVNLRTGTYPGSLVIDPYDEIVYSTGDLGKRLHWIYWVPDTTTDALNDNFQVKWVIDWDGENWTYDWSTGDWLADGPENGWVEPSSWENYSNGVIGSVGFAWWASDDDALPYDTDGKPYNETDQADIDALRCQVLQSQTFAEGFVRIRNDQNSDWEVYSLRVKVPDSGSSLVLAALGVAGLAGFSRRLKR